MVVSHYDFNLISLMMNLVDHFFMHLITVRISLSVCSSSFSLPTPGSKILYIPVGKAINSLKLDCLVGITGDHLKLGQYGILTFMFLYFRSLQ